MDGPGTPQQRIGSTERDDAIAALAAHREAGRLTSEEYEDRSVAAGRAQFWSDLDELFTDLPEPQPARPAGPPAVRAPAPPSAAPSTAARPPADDSPGWEQFLARYGSTAVALTAVAATALFFLTRSWLWFLLVAAVAVAVNAGRDKDKRR